MLIAVDAAPLGEQKKTGIAQYAGNILEELSKYDSNNRFLLFGVTSDSKMLDFGRPKFVTKEMPFRLLPSSHWYIWTLWYYSGFSLELKVYKPDLFISTYPSIPPLINCPSIVIIYDLTPLVLKDAHRLDFKVRFRLQVTNAVKRSSRIVTISQSTKNEIVSYFGINPQKVDVISPGFDNKLFGIEQDLEYIDEIKSRFGIGGEYILYVGTLEPKKNINRLIDAFCQLKKQKGISEKLVIAGKSGWNDKKIFQKFKSSGFEKEIIYSGYVSYMELHLLMSGAEVFVFPSLHEGFGMPPLEAMACGTPVIASNRSSLPEVVGDAGILVDPYSVNAIADAIYRVISDADLRKDMRQKGLQRAKLFTWEKSAKQLLGIIESFRPINPK